jgi:hypothetical protein
MHAPMVQTVPMLLVLMLAVSFAGEPPKPPASSAPSIEGTYQFISRKLPDGTRLSPPNMMGLCTYTKSHRNFNIVEQDATGKFSSTSRVSTYTLTATEYSETLLFLIVNNQIGGKDIVYDLSGQTGSVPVTVEAGRIQFKAPLSTSQRSYVFEGNKWISTSAEGSVDVWEKVE